jgi:Cytotoxic
MRLPALLLGVLLGAAGLGVACEATGDGGCRPAAGAAAEATPTPEPEQTADRRPTCTTATSPVWQRFKPHRGDVKSNGGKGSNARYYTWNHTHGDIEVYDGRGRHLGSMDPASGQMIKPAVPDRSIDLG